MSLSQPTLDRLVERRLARLLDRCEEAGVIDASTRQGIARLSADEESSTEEERAPVAVAAAVAVAAVTREPPPLPPRRAADRLELHTSMADSTAQASALFLHAPTVAGASEGLAALAILDEPKGPGVAARAWSVFSENIGWFIGALLVLAGSVYGVREAWNALGDVARHAVVAGALLAYHAAFVGAGAALSRASASAGRVLATIGAGLLPMTLAVLASLVASSPVIGLAAGAVALLAVTPTLASVGRRWALQDPHMVLRAMGPALAAQLFVQLPAVGEAAALLPVAGLVGVWMATRATPGLISLPVLGFSLYGHLALELASGIHDALELSVGALPLALVVARGALLATRLHWVATQPAEREERPAFVTLEVALLATLATASLVATGQAWSDEIDPGTAIASAGAVAFAAYAFRRSIAHHPAARHFVVPLTALAGSLLLAELSPLHPELWPAGATVATCVWLGWARRRPDDATTELRWASGVALLALAMSWGLSSGNEIGWSVFAAAAPVAVTWTMAVPRRPWLHYVAGLAVVACIASWRVPLSPHAGWFETALASGAILLLAGLVHQRIVAEGSLRPWADLSLFALAAAPLLLFATRADATPAPGAMALFASGALLVLRGLLDRSTLVAVPGFTLVALAAVAILDPASPAARALMLAVASLTCLLVGALRRGPPVRWMARRLFAAIELPWAAPPRALVSMALGAAGALLAALALQAWSGWLDHRLPADRLHATLTMGLLAAGALTAFLLRSLETLQARGSALTLGLMGGLIALTALSHRIDRPRPLEDAAWRATLAGLVVWLVAVGLQRYGQALSQRLGRPSHGRLYHALAHLAVLLMGLRLLAKSVPSLSLGTTPPMALAGPALLAGLMAWSLRSSVALHATHALLLPAAMLIAAQERLFGSSPPGTTSQSQVSGSLTGAALATLAFAAFAWWSGRREDADHTRRTRCVPAIWTLVGAALLSACAFSFASLTEALLVATAGAILSTTPSRRLGLVTAGLGTLLSWHALANFTPFIAPWIGPAAAATALVAVGLLAKPSSVRLASVFSAALLIEGAVYALAAGAPSDALQAVPNALEQAAKGLFKSAFGAWPAVVFLLLATLVQARVAILKAKSEHPSGVTRTLGQAAIASGAMAMSICFWFTDGLDALAWSVPALVLVGAGWHLVTARLKNAEAPLRRGMRLGRDLLLVSASLLPVVMSFARGTVSETQLILSAGGLIGAMLVAAHAIWLERRTRHVYGLQLLAVGTYAYVRDALGLEWPPEVDATVVLALGFVLLGATIVARRLDVPPVATATRRFAALLPLAVVWLMPSDATEQAAALSAASGALWASLAWAGQSRWLGSLGAAALNFALLVFALASGLEGIEVFLAPLGLMLLALGQIFAASLPDGARLAIRVLGALALYLPAAVQVALQVGNARDGFYPVLFGVACLVGVGVGVLLRIRAYLALGTGFLALDVIAGLFHAGRRDHRIAVLVLSLSGLAVLGLMIYVTLKREKVQRLRASLREQWADWD